MSTSQVLQQLYSLDISSPNLSRYLYCLIERDEEEQYLSSLQGSESGRLVDFLDQVRTLPSTFRPVTEGPSGSWRHPRYRRCFPEMSTQTTHHL